MDRFRIALVLAGLVAAAANAAPRTNPPQLPPRLLQVSGPFLIRATAARPSSHVFEVRYSGTGGHLDVRHDVRGLEAEPVIDPLGGGRFRVTFSTRDDVPEGMARGTLTVRMCKDHPCVHPIAGAIQSRQLRVLLAWVDGPDWSTHQGNAAHDGHVPIAVDPRRISHAWSWNLGPDSHMVAFQQVATSGGLGFVTARLQSDSPGSLLAFDLEDASIRWRHDFSSTGTAPATWGGRVYASAMGDQPMLWSFDASDGAPQALGEFDVLRGQIMAPTIADGVAYVNGGLGYRQGVYAFDADDGLPLWTAHGSAIDGTTPAVADGRVYHHDGETLHIYDAFDGTGLQAIEDPLNKFGDISYGAAPVLGSADHVIAFSGGYSYFARRLVDFAPSLGGARWVSEYRYSTAPAVNDGIVYAGVFPRDGIPTALHAISEATGEVSAQWIPGADPWNSFGGNVIVTRNLVFVSSSTGTHALDRRTLQPVWYTPEWGHMSISAGGVLLMIAPSTNLSTVIHAFSLRGR